MKKNTHLFIVDPQNSFCEVVNVRDQGTVHSGELCIAQRNTDGTIVPIAWNDMIVLGDFIKNDVENDISGITISLDTHPYIHVSHPSWFKRIDNGLPPEPFTTLHIVKDKIVDAAGVEYTTTNPNTYNWTKKAIDFYGVHVIWPPHCLQGTPGNNVVAPLQDALIQWTQKTGLEVQYVIKGLSPMVEQFSAIKAKLVDPNDRTTELNLPLLNRLSVCDEILFSGEALSHCVNNTITDIANVEGWFNGRELIRKVTLLRDTTSNVPGFEKMGEDFLQEMQGMGMRVTTTKEYRA